MRLVSYVISTVVSIPFRVRRTRKNARRAKEKERGKGGILTGRRAISTDRLVVVCGVYSTFENASRRARSRIRRDGGKGGMLTWRGIKSATPPRSVILSAATTRRERAEERRGARWQKASKASGAFSVLGADRCGALLARRRRRSRRKSPRRRAGGTGSRKASGRTWANNKTETRDAARGTRRLRELARRGAD